MRVRTQLVVMAAAFILPVVMAAGIALDKIMEGERKAALRGLSETVRATALIVDREVQGSLSGLKALGTSPHLETGNFEAFYGQAKAQDVPPDVWTLLLDSSGTQLLNTAVPFGTPPPPAVSLERVKKVIATQKPLITDVFTGPVTGKKLITIYLPAAASGGKSLVVAQAFSVDHWKKTALQHPLPADWVVAVIDKTGKFISRSHRADELLGQPARPELVSAAAAQDGLIRHTTLEGVDSYDAFAHSALTGWTIAVAAPVTSIEAAAQRAVQVALIGILLAVAAAVVAIAVFGRRLMEAFESAQVAAIELGQGRKPVVLASSIHEVNAFNFALAEAGTLLELERTARQVAEQEKLNLLQAATQARQAAEAQNIAKDKFLAMLGHELRNPLAAISGAIALLEIPGADSRRLVRCTGIISRQNRHLRHIVDDLLDVSRLLAGKIELVKAPLDLAECVNNCVEALRTTEGAQKTRIVVRADSVWVNGDGVRLEQILNNLLGNALKFSMPGGQINVRVEALSGRAVVTIQDTGSGMPPELLTRVFEPFFQGPAPFDGMQSGLGIGLALVKQLVELHGGEVTATSAGANQGSTFTFSIPQVPGQNADLLEVPIKVQNHLKIVYVEDNADARTMMAELLSLFGLEVIEAADGAAALDIIPRVRPDVVLMDVGLPDLSGYEVARRLREDPANRSIPLIALTGYGQVQDKDAATAAGFSAHLVKPADPADILRTIEELTALPGGQDRAAR